MIKQPLVLPRISTTLDQQIPDASEQEHVEVELPKGPAAYCTERINGKPPKGSFHVKRTYHVTIEPGGQEKLVRSGSKRRMPTYSYSTEDEGDTTLKGSDDEGEGASESGSPQHVVDALHKRQSYFAKSSFRQKRAPVFGKAKHFPALANHRLVPEWRENSSHYTDGDTGLSPRERTQRRLVAPTVAGAVRQQSKRAASPPPGWLPHLDCGDVQRQYSRIRRSEDHYISPQDAALEDVVKNKRRWIGEGTFAGPSVPGAKMAILRTNQGPDCVEVEQEIYESRGRGVKNNEKLQCRYEQRLEAYKDKQERRGPMSNFAKREMKLQASKRSSALEDVPRSSSRDREAFGLGMGLGFARFRSEKLAIE